MSSSSKNRSNFIDSFNLSRFVRTNKVILIWVAFFSLIYLMRNMFGLLFVTFILCFIMHSLTNKLTENTRWGRKFCVVCLYLVFITLITALTLFVVPKLTGEAKNFTEQWPTTVYKLKNWLLELGLRYPDLAPLLERARDALTIEGIVEANPGQTWALIRKTLEQALHYLSWFFIGTLFSFLIMLDFPGLAAKIKALKYTRAGAVYDETAESVMLFARVVGENFQAQIMVSTVNTMLTALGLTLLGVGNVALLCTIVFFCGLIPVAGVFISSIPIILVAVNTGGLKMAWAVLLMIVIIHLIEAYVLNPRIVSAVMRINPVMTLIILYLAHALIGMWGMLLGVPISVYIYRQLIMAPPKNEPLIVSDLTMPTSSADGGLTFGQAPPPDAGLGATGSQPNQARKKAHK